jgi:hypothetical protein
MYTHSGLLQKQIYLGVPYLNDVKLLYNFLLNGMFGQGKHCLESKHLN